MAPGTRFEILEQPPILKTLGNTQTYASAIYSEGEEVEAPSAAPETLSCNFNLYFEPSPAKQVESARPPTPPYPCDITTVRLGEVAKTQPSGRLARRNSKAKKRTRRLAREAARFRHSVFAYCDVFPKQPNSGQLFCEASSESESFVFKAEEIVRAFGPGILRLRPTTEAKPLEAPEAERPVLPH